MVLGRICLGQLKVNVKATRHKKTETFKHKHGFSKNKQSSGDPPLASNFARQNIKLANTSTWVFYAFRRAKNEIMDAPYTEQIRVHTKLRRPTHVWGNALTRFPSKKPKHMFLRDLRRKLFCPIDFNFLSFCNRNYGIELNWVEFRKCNIN